MADCVVCRRRPPQHPHVCDGCRKRLHNTLAEIVDLYALLPGAMVPGSATGEKVSGTREAPLPLRVDPLDLSLPLRGGGVVHDPDGDQTGMVPVVWTLDTWVRDWRDTLWPNHRLPAPTVATLCGWLRNRLDDACDQHPAIAEFAGDITRVHTDLRRVLGLLPLRHRLHAPCPQCDMLTLYRDDGADYVECGSCGRVWSEDEYARLVIVIAGEVA